MGRISQALLDDLKEEASSFETRKWKEFQGKRIDVMCALYKREGGVVKDKKSYFAEQNKLLDELLEKTRKEIKEGIDRIFSVIRN